MSLGWHTLRNPRAAEAGHLPPICARSGSAAETHVRLRYVTSGWSKAANLPVVGGVILGGPVVGAALAPLAVGIRFLSGRKVAVPVTASARNEHRIRSGLQAAVLVLSWVLFVGCGLVVLEKLVDGESTDQQFDQVPSSMWIGLGVGVALYFGSWLVRPRVRMRVRRSGVQLRAHPSFLAAMTGAVRPWSVGGYGTGGYGPGGYGAGGDGTGAYGPTPGPAFGAAAPPTAHGAPPAAYGIPPRGPMPPSVPPPRW